jgi:dipeptidyl aminopeptidase/acylaminoacyl peptidase
VLVAFAVTCATASGGPRTAESQIEVPGDQPPLAKAVGAAAPGDTILLDAGTYSPSVVVPSSKHDLTIRGADRNAVVFDGHNARKNAITVHANGVTIENISAHSYLGNVFYWEDVRGFNAHYLTVWNIQGYGVYSEGSTDGTVPAYASTSYAAAISRLGPARGRIAYSKDDGHIWVVNADGRDARRVTSSSSARDIDPSWSPDGQKIVFKAVPTSAAPNSRASVIVVSNLDGAGRHPISPHRDVESPRWSPDGTLIAFQLKGRIALVRPDGRGLKVLPIRGGCPSWAPDSKLIAICGDDGHIYTIAPDGSGRRRLTIADGVTDVPGPWSPDGKRLSLVRERRQEVGMLFNEGDIYVINADGSSPKRVTRIPGYEAPNAWLRSGEIIFPRYGASGGARWFAVRADGRDLRWLSQLRIAFDPIDWHE